MFERCRAFIAADNPNVAEILGLTARSLGFGEIASQYPRVAMRGAHIALTYFFADARTGDDAAARAARHGARAEAAAPLLFARGAVHRRRLAARRAQVHSPGLR